MYSLRNTQEAQNTCLGSACSEGTTKWQSAVNKINQANQSKTPLKVVVSVSNLKFSQKTQFISENKIALV